MNRFSNSLLKTCLAFIFIWMSGYCVLAQTETLSTFGSPVEYINSNFENASPLLWEYNSDGSVFVHIPYDHERNTPNRQATHVYFQVQAKQGSDVTLFIRIDDSMYNGRKSTSAYANYRHIYISDDGIHWTTVPVEKIDQKIKVKLRMNAGVLYVASLEPYRISDLDKLLKEIENHPLVEIEPIGQTVEGRQLEMVRVGNPAAPFRVFIRARSHPWEPGGNWVVQGLIKSLLENDPDNAKYLNKYCLYIMPMANKDGVARGYTRFNSLGMDLNRNTGRPADPVLSPENHAMETWLKKMIDKGMKPQIAIDMHNHQGAEVVMYGHPNNVKSKGYESDGLITFKDYFLNLDKNCDVGQYDSNIRKFESLMCQHTWYTQPASSARDYPANAANASVPRYKVDFACVLELSNVWIGGLNKAPFASDWLLFGKKCADRK